MGQRVILENARPFVARDRARARRRMLRRRWVAALVMPLAFASCVVRPPESVARIGRPAAAGNAVSVSATSSMLTDVGQRDRMRATLCLASAIYYEAATESDDGQRAVAQVVLNRVRHGREWPNTVCGVVYQGSGEPGCQFSFACDGAMGQTPSLTAWIRARRVAEAALAGETYAPVGSATFYHTTAVAPGWRTRMIPVGVVGAHIFYRLPGDAPDADALPVVYRGGEPLPGPLPGFVAATEIAPVKPVPAMPVPVVRQAATTLPDSDIRPEWRDSGRWIAD